MRRNWVVFLLLMLWLVACVQEVSLPLPQNASETFFGQPRTAVSGIRIQGAETRVDLPGRQLQCADTSESTTQCQMVLEGELLELAITYGDSSKTYLVNCQASYAGDSVECTAYFTLTHASPYVVIYNDLGINESRVEALKRQNLILQFDESDWHQGLTVLGVSIAVTTVIILWVGAGNHLEGVLHKQHKLYAWRKLVSPACLLITGLIAFQISRFVLTIMLLLFNFVD